MTYGFEPGELIVCRRSHMAFSNSEIVSIMDGELLVVVAMDLCVVKALRLEAGDVVSVLSVDLPGEPITFERYTA